MNLTPVFRIKKQFQYLNTNIQIFRTQIPLRICEGLTVHKSQGSTLSRVVVTLRPTCVKSLAYVAYSRVGSLNNLYLVKSFRKPNLRKTKNDEIVTAEMERLRLNPYVPNFSEMYPHNPSYSIYSINVQSLRKHRDMLQNDPFYKKATLVILQETWLSERDECSLDNFYEICRNQIPFTRGSGTICFVKDEFKQEIEEFGDFSIPTKFDMTYFIWRNIYVINIYKHPQVSVREFILFLNEKINIGHTRNHQTLVIGDFNINFIVESREAESFKDFLKNNFNLRLISPIQPTTNSNTCIDAIFGTPFFEQQFIIVYESLFSYHKPLVLVANNNN